MASCSVCLRQVSARQVKLECCDCEKVFHGVCVKISKEDVECLNSDGLTWRCDPCASNRRKSFRFEAEALQGKLTLEDIMMKINEIADMQKKQEHSFNDSYELLTKKLEENTEKVKEQTTSVENCLKIINTLVEENTKLTKKVEELETRIEDMEQYSRANALEIHGVPMQQNEDVVEVVKEVGKALNMEVTSSMIDACHRLGRKSGSGGPPPGIIVKFVRRMDKDELLKKRKVKSNLSTRHMNLGVDQPIYINEALSPARRRLFAAARQVKRDKHFKYLWVRGGKIFLRKQESYPVVQVTCQADLSKL